MTDFKSKKDEIYKKSGSCLLGFVDDFKDSEIFQLILQGQNVEYKAVKLIC